MSDSSQSQSTAGWLIDETKRMYSIDHWALKQVFPVMPLQALGQMPERVARLVDITCDSDGKVDQFISPKTKRDTLPLHLPGAPARIRTCLGFS